jgi:hypothetical protein
MEQIVIALPLDGTLTPGISLLRNRPSGTPAVGPGAGVHVAVVVGAYVIATGQQKLVDNVRKPTLSVFQIGLRFVLRLWQRGQSRKFHWHLPMLTEASK